MDSIYKNLEKSFEELGVNCDESVIEKCLEICRKNGISEAEELVDCWMAYSVSHLQGANPTLAHLNRFERDEFTKKNKEDSMAVVEPASTSLVIYEAATMDVDSGEQSEDLLSAYTREGGAKADKRQTTPQNNASKRSRINGLGAHSPQVAFSPASFSPTIATPSSKYTSRTDAGDVVARYSPAGVEPNWKDLASGAATLREVSRPLHSRYMCYDLVDCVDLADETIERLGLEILENSPGIVAEDLVPVRHKHPTSLLTIGRIGCDADGRLNSKSVILEGSRDSCSGDTVQLDLSTLEKYSVFPGQVVVVEGFNVTGDKLVVRKMHCEVAISAGPLPQLEGAMSIMVASGPFTQSDSMNYQPLLDLTQRVAAEQPHLLILTGPFIDVNHPAVVENNIAETFQTLFGKLVDQIMKPIEGLRTEVVLVASYKDCHGSCVYPTPALHLAVTRNYPKLHLLPDPYLLDIEGVIIGFTSTDTLMHLGKEEISCPPHSADRLSRLANHVISQRSFYPLCPPPEDLPLDVTLMDAVKLPVTPHILVLPSDLRYFIKDVKGCVVVNPERLAKGVVGGTFAHLLVSNKGISGQIVKI